MTRVAELLGVGTPETVRKWVRQGQVDGGERPGTATEESAEVRRLKRGEGRAETGNAIRKAAPALGRARPTLPLVAQLIDLHVDLLRAPTTSENHRRRRDVARPTRFGG
jgi:hypothetical protein